MGLVGFCFTLSMEGAKYNVLANTIVPIAYSRMSASVMAPGRTAACPSTYIKVVHVYIMCVYLYMYMLIYMYMYVYVAVANSWLVLKQDPLQ